MRVWSAHFVTSWFLPPLTFWNRNKLPRLIVMDLQGKRAGRLGATLSWSGPSVPASPWGGQPMAALGVRRASVTTGRAVSRRPRFLHVQPRAGLWPRGASARVSRQDFLALERDALLWPLAARPDLPHPQPQTELLGLGNLITCLESDRDWPLAARSAPSLPTWRATGRPCELRGSFWC